MFSKGDTDILVLHSDEGRHFILKRILRFINILLWASGVCLLATGIFVNVDLSHANSLVDVSVFRTVNVLLVISGSVIVVFSLLGCFDYFFRRRSTLCVLSYLVTLVFVLQCIVAALAFSWRSEIGTIVGQKLERYVREGNNKTNSSDKFVAIDYIQRRFECCGARSYADWAHSSWLKDKKLPRDIPYTCCKVYVSVADCNLNNTDKVYTKGCVPFLRQRYEMNFLILGVVAIFVSFFQFACFHVVNYLMFKLE